MSEYTGHTNYVFDLAISPDGQTAASWDMDRSFHVWEVVSVRRLACLTGITGRSLFLPNSGVLIFYGPLAGTLIINPTHGEVIQELPPSQYAAVAPTVAGSYRVMAMTLSSGQLRLLHNGGHDADPAE